MSSTIKDTWNAPRLISERSRHDPQWCIRQCKTPLPLSGGTWAFPAESKHVLIHWTVYSMGFFHPWQIKTMAITLTNGRWNCRKQVSLMDPQVVMSFYCYSFFSILFFLFFFSPIYFLIFMLLHGYIYTDSNQNGYTPPFYWNQIFLRKTCHIHIDKHQSFSVISL